MRVSFLLAVVVSFFYNLHAIPLFDLDEGAFSEATREMLQRGDFISPYLNGVPRFDKPVFIHWLQAASTTLFGFTEFALRLPSALAACLWVTTVYAFLRKLRDEHTALLAAIAMTASLEIPIIAKAATADAVLNLFITAAMLTAYLFHYTHRHRWLYSCFFLMGLGFLTKGPIAVLIPAATTFLFYLSRNELRFWLRTVFNPVGIGIFLATALPWYIAQYLHQGNAFIAGFFLKHNIDRFQDAMEGHSGNVLYYIPVVLLGVIPYTTVLINSFSRIKTIWRDELGRYALLWFLFVFVFFSLSGTKLPHYVVYGYGGLFILMALTFEPKPSRGWLLLPPLLLFTGLLFLPQWISIALPKLHDGYVHDMLSHYTEYFTMGYRWFFLGAVVVTIYFMIEKRLSKILKLYVVGMLTVLGVSAYIMPVIGAMQQVPVKEAALIAKQNDYSVVMWRINTPSFDVYSKRLVEKRDPKPGDIVLTKSIFLPQLGKIKILYEKNGIALVKVLPEETKS